jgi:hypothetical protein
MINKKPGRCTYRQVPMSRARETGTCRHMPLLLDLRE